MKSPSSSQSNEEFPLEPKFASRGIQWLHTKTKYQESRKEPIILVKIVAIYEYPHTIDVFAS
jgi:hypothetical protein